jgi:hypothetical protein
MTLSRSQAAGLLLLAAIVFPVSGAVASLSGQQAAVTGGIGIRLFESSAAARQDPLARSYIVNRLPPGASVQRQVEVTNGTASVANVSVYPAAAALLHGQFAFAGGHSRNELSSWTSVSRPTLRLSPGAKAIETVTIHVAKDASSSERYGVVWAEVSVQGSGGSRGVTLANRVGVRMYVSVGPGGAPPLDFVIGPLSAKRASSGDALLVAKVHNKSRRTIDIRGSLTLAHGPGGVRAGPFSAKLALPLSPGATKLLTVRLDRRLPRGPWRAELRLQSGTIRRVATAQIMFPRRP